MWGLAVTSSDVVNSRYRRAEKRFGGSEERQLMYPLLSVSMQLSVSKASAACDAVSPRASVAKAEVRSDKEHGLLTLRESTVLVT